MFNKFTLFTGFLSLIFCASCVDLFDPNLTNDRERLVVDGRVTTEFDFQWIYLTYDAGYNSSETNFSNLVKNAKVWVTDDKGNRFDFIDDTNPKGNVLTGFGFDYRSKDRFQAVVGRTYQLFIQTQNGKNYTSKPEKIRAIPPIEKVYTEFRELSGSNLSPRGEFLIYTDLKDSPTTGEFYQWETIHQEQIVFCRYWVLRGNFEPQYFRDKCCGDCWESSICQECKQFASDKLINGKEIRKKYLGKAPYTDTKPYYLMIKQYSISEETFKFWNAVQAQAQNSGGLFDTTPESVRGNISNTNDTNEEVLGIFSACDVAERIVYIDRNITGIKPFDPPAFSIYNTTNVCFSCIDGPTRSSAPPKGWKYLK
jgi:hypothetical protein